MTTHTKPPSLAERIREVADDACTERGEVEPLLAEVAALEAENAELRARLAEADALVRVACRCGFGHDFAAYLARFPSTT